jgi:hypothetical protein
MQHEICFIRIKEQVDKKRDTLGTHIKADCLSKNTSTEHNKNIMSVSQKYLLELVFFS